MNTNTNIKPLSVGGLFKHIYRSEGVAGLFRGAGARILFHAPSTAITMALFETCQSWWNKQLN